MHFVVAFFPSDDGLFVCNTKELIFEKLTAPKIGEKIKKSFSVQELTEDGNEIKVQQLFEAYIVFEDHCKFHFVFVCYVAVCDMFFCQNIYRKL